MELFVNGERQALDGSPTVADLLARLGVPEERVVVERNGAIVPRARFGGEPLAPGDRVEIVRFVGGG